MEDLFKIGTLRYLPPFFQEIWFSNSIFRASMYLPLFQFSSFDDRHLVSRSERARGNGLLAAWGAISHFGIIVCLFALLFFGFYIRKSQLFLPLRYFSIITTESSGNRDLQVWIRWFRRTLPFLIKSPSATKFRDVDSRQRTSRPGTWLEAAWGTQPNVKTGETDSWRA